MNREKKRLGQFFTDEKIADFMAKLVINKDTKTVLDPAAGEGAFIKAIEKINKKVEIVSFEIDKKIIETLNSINYDKHEIKNEDYLYNFSNIKYDAIICNPPYNKFQKIKNRNELISVFEEKYQIHLSGYTNYCMYFLIKSLNELSDNGKCVYIIPYEFMNCKYGEVVKKYLLSEDYIKAVYKFDNSINLFDEAITTSCILVFEKCKHKSIEFINITDLDELQSCNFQNKKNTKKKILILMKSG